MMSNNEIIRKNEFEKLKFQLTNELSHIADLMDEIDRSLNNPIEIDFNALQERIISKISTLNKPKSAEKRKCKCCDNTFTGRKDKVYCTISCKTNYHNVLNREVLKVSVKTNSQLRRNHAILLSKTILEQKTKVAQIELELAGFNFDFSTGIFLDKTNQVESIRFYDFTLTQTEYGIFEIQKLKQPLIYEGIRALKKVKFNESIKGFILAQNKPYLRVSESI